MSAPKRRLAAVWFADIVGFTALSGQNEPLALQLAAVMQKVVRERVGADGGKVVKFLGDGALAEFPSTEAAVHSALAVQQEFNKAARALGSESSLRIGVHVGDILAGPDGDVLGDGVNVAARLQTAAEPGQVVISDDVWRQVRQQPNYSFVELGSRELKGISESRVLYAVTAHELKLKRAPRRVWLRRSPAVRFAIGLAFIAEVAALVALLLPRVRHHTTSTDSVAVLPFDVLGGPELGYLKSGIVEMVSRNIDGAANLRAVSPEVVISVTNKPKPPATLAKLLAARFIMSGNIAQAGDSVRVTMTVQDFAAANAAPTRWTVSGRTNDLLNVIDRVSAQLLVATRSGEAVRLMASAAVTTQSLPALRAYLQGEEFYRQANYDSAIAHFSEATNLDSTFALAYYRRATALYGNYDFASMRPLLDRAVQFSSRLTARDADLVRSFVDFYDGHYSTAEKQLRDLLARFPNDIEAAYNLAELLTYANPRHGRSVLEAKPLIDQVVTYDPHFLCPRCMRLNFAVKEGNYSLADTLMSGLGDTLRYILVRAYQLHDSARVEAIFAAYDQQHRGDTHAVAALIYLGEPDAAIRMARTTIKNGRNDYWRGRGYLSLAYASAERGQVREALQALAAANRLQPGIDDRVAFASVPFVSFPRATLTALRAEILKSDSTGDTAEPITQLLPHYRWYALGIVACRLGEHAEALRLAQKIEDRPAPSYWEPSKRAMAVDLRVFVDMARGDAQAALRKLESISSDVPLDLVLTPLNRNVEVVWHAELLYMLQRDAEALRRYENVLDGAVTFLPTKSLTLLRRAELHDRRGDRDEAAQLYGQFLKFWNNPDPDLQPVVQRARNRLVAMQHKVD